MFDSWMNDRAILYRKMENIPAEWGTAVSVQSMVFGNMGETSATGVCFSRDAATGEDVFIGSNNSLVAPVKVGDGATTAAGSTINQDVDNLQLGVARARQRNIDGWKRPVKIKKT